VAGHDQGIRRAGGVQRLPQAAERQQRFVQVRLRYHQQVDVARQLEMLKPIVKEMHRAAELALGQAAGQVPIG
jgi:hypothetical protein